MTASDWTMQRLADLLDAPVDRLTIQKTTALGAACLAGLAAGAYPEPAKFADNWRLEHRFKPNMSAATRERKLKGWARGGEGTLASDEGEEYCAFSHLDEGFSMPRSRTAANGIIGRSSHERVRLMCAGPSLVGVALEGQLT